MTSRTSRRPHALLWTKRGFVAVAAVALALFQAGCATVTRDMNQPVGLTAPNCTQPVLCTFANKKGTWTAQAPGMVSVRRSDDPLRVSCTSGGRQWHDQVLGQRGGRAWGNAILGGGIGAIVDANTDAHWDYPASIAIPICSR